MSFISLLKKSPLKHKHKHDTSSTSTSLSMFSTSQANTTRNLVVYPIDTEDDTNYNVTVNNEDIGDILMTKVCGYYGLGNYKEYFGLKYVVMDERGNHEILWLDLLKQIGRQLKYSNTNVLTFRVKHFPAKPHQIDCEHVRYLLFLQLKNYLQKGELQLSLSDECALAGCVVQAIYEDYDEKIHLGNYIEDQKFISKKSLKSDEMIIEEHKKLKGYKRGDAEALFLEKVCQYNTYGTEITVLKNKQGVMVNFGVSHKGVITYLHGVLANVARMEIYPWSQIGKVNFEGRTLQIHAHTPEVHNPEVIKKHTMIFKCYSERVCKHLWKYILDQKAFFTFNRGEDVPKSKSSNSIFKRTSKFRYTGRCEHEILVSQHQNHNETFNSTMQSSFRRKFVFKTNPNAAAAQVQQEQANSKFLEILPPLQPLPQSIRENNEKSFSDSGVSENLSEIAPTHMRLTDEILKEDDEILSKKLNDSQQNQSIQSQNNKSTTAKATEPNATSTPQQVQKQIEKRRVFENSKLGESTTDTDTADSLPHQPPPQPHFEQNDIDRELLAHRQDQPVERQRDAGLVSFILSNLKFLIITILLIIIIFLLGLNYSRRTTNTNTTGNCIYTASIRNSHLFFDPIFIHLQRGFRF